ncbi:putative hydroxymethylpyrimidine transporter CytX [Hansschlegelia sp.]|uniref:putative hydroxymethylpyrimidine transporter CytX n=1 Tax=Hansschlegelia sp. TaxID=2041892 RepID=UPI002C36C94C|nr:putative hydroxymethylpyrimidine transporter CytX [Hansschlegelia sp.]HVI30116.1 putative hydroxymethylpyrimidine transporter CytX [Hansschlegelia sp.]
MSSADVSYAPLIPVPAERRVFAARDAFALWFSLGLGLLVLQAGSLLVPALSLGQALAAVVCGTLVGVLPLALAGMIGAETGLAAMATLRPSLGLRGAAIPAVLNVIQLVGWGAFEIIVMADAADTLTRGLIGVSSPVVWTLLFGGLATAIAAGGPVSFVRRFLREWGLYLILAASAWLTYALLARQDLAALFARPGQGGMGFGAAVDLVAAMPLSWLPVIADYGRFHRSAEGAFRGSALGYFVGNVWFYGLGATYALVSGGEASIATTLALAGGGFALLLILLDETDNAFAAVHSAAVSTGTLTRVPVRRLALGFGALCTLIALSLPLTEYEGFLLLIGSVFAPLFGVVLADYFVARRRRIDVAEIDRRGGAYWFAGGLRPAGLVAWLAGVAVYHGVGHLLPDLGATLPAMAASAAIFLLATRMRG